MHDRVSAYTFWKNEDPVNYSMHLSQTFGSPDELTDFRSVWYDKDGFKRIVVKDEYILHGSPAPHFDFIYCYIDLKVPHNLADALANSSESILIDFLKNEVGARCGSITANAVTLNYVLDVVAGRVRPSKNEYEKRILQMKDMFKKGETYSNDWWPDETNDADPKNPYYNKDNDENIEEASPVVAAMMRAKARISPSYKMAKKELKDKVKKDPSKAKISHAAMVAKKYSGVDARTLHDVTEQGKGLYYNINKKRKEGRAMRKKGAPGAPKPSDFDKAKQTASEESQPIIGGVKMKKLGKGKPGSYKSLVSRHLGASAAEKIDKSDGSKLVAKGKKTGNKDLVRKGNFIKNIIGR